MTMDLITIFTDGSSRGNPGPGGYAAIVAFPDTVSELGGREANTTNNRMELTGVIKALEFVLDNLGDGRQDAKGDKYSVKLFSDSRYVIRGITEWVRGWRAKGWIGAQKKPVENRDLWEKLLEAVEALEEKDIPIAWIYVSGHSGVAANERVDVIATSFADGETVELFSGASSGYGISLSSEGDASMKQDRSAAKKRSRQAAYSYVSKVDGVVRTHATWAECEARVRGAKGARFKKVFTPGEEAALAAEWENS